MVGCKPRNEERAADWQLSPASRPVMQRASLGYARGDEELDSEAASRPGHFIVLDVIFSLISLG